jgi:hypothetical protein
MQLMHASEVSNEANSNVQRVKCLMSSDSILQASENNENEWTMRIPFEEGK